MTAEGIGRGPRAAQPHAVVRILLRALLTAAPAAREAPALSGKDLKAGSEQEKRTGYGC